MVATSKGLVVGDLSFVNSEGVNVDCRLAAGGETIPQVKRSVTRYGVGHDERIGGRGKGSREVGNKS